MLRVKLLGPVPVPMSPVVLVFPVPRGGMATVPKLAVLKYSVGISVRFDKELEPG